MKTYPHFPKRNDRCLDGIWDFTFLGEDCDLNTIDIKGAGFTGKATVPGCFDTVLPLTGKRGTALYRTSFDLTPGKAGELRFRGLGLWCRVYVDGEALFEGAYPYSGFTVAVPASDKRERVLTVAIDNRFDFDRVPLMEQYFDFYGYGGIYRSVEISELPGKPLRRLEVTTIDPAAGKISLNLRTAYETAESSISAEVTVEGKKQTVALKKGSDGYTAEMTLPGLSPWSPSSPALHEISLETAEDLITERFGLRKITTEQGQVKINGEPVKLLGYCRHESHPQYGPCLPLQQLLQDLHILRDMGCNFIRGSHYPQDPRFLDLCDEMGFMVWEESIGWGQREKSFSSSKFHEQQVHQTRLMVENSYNHPSVVMWGFLNEGASNEEYARPLYEDLFKTIREKDKSRPVTYASMFPFDDLFFDQADIVSINQYPGWYAQGESTRPLEEVPAELDKYREMAKAKGLADKPMIISEMGAGAFYGWRDPHHAHWSEEYQADYLDQLTREITTREDYSGVSLWQFCDSRTYDNKYALGRPRGFNNKGTVDEYRRPKMAYDRVKANFLGYARKG